MQTNILILVFVAAVAAVPHLQVKHNERFVDPLNPVITIILDDEETTKQDYQTMGEITLQFLNSGDETVTLSDPLISSPFLRLTSLFPESLPAGQTVSVVLAFKVPIVRLSALFSFIANDDMKEHRIQVVVDTEESTVAAPPPSSSLKRAFSDEPLESYQPDDQVPPTLKRFQRNEELRVDDAGYAYEGDSYEGDYVDDYRDSDPRENVRYESYFRPDRDEVEARRLGSRIHRAHVLQERNERLRRIADLKRETLERERDRVRAAREHIDRYPQFERDDGYYNDRDDDYYDFDDVDYQPRVSTVTAPLPTPVNDVSSSASKSEAATAATGQVASVSAPTLPTNNTNNTNSDTIPVSSGLDAMVTNLPDQANGQHIDDLSPHPSNSSESSESFDPNDPKTHSATAAGPSVNVVLLAVLIPSLVVVTLVLVITVVVVIKMRGKYAKLAKMSASQLDEVMKVHDLQL